ncbi:MULTISPECIES: DUF2759 domain-containing protein [Alteribacter]|uniref:DUF2759 domain-containing protein n=1 Tax=Alteribacter keqinensis TaxID=2483800 RepID=A0A3M7TUK2_9BACI|nr:MULTISPECIES: DUF2759 domain-containing protein [Alteribacter]MBM7097326.1 DUF2759 domain-containing protein [Alteribacter salitolerans]RNA68941.1 DUF2759 domain-containing protein [Alteribacter keqinensis]
MAFGIICLLVAILSALGLFRELKNKNFFAVGFAAVTVAVFGWFSVMTIFSYIVRGGGGAM